MKNKICTLILVGVLSVFSMNVSAAPSSCKDILNAINANNEMGGTYSSVYDALKAGAEAAIIDMKASHEKDKVGLGNDMWATINNRDGVICAVVFTGDDRGSQWPGSRLISAEKAYTANAYSLDGFAVSTANLYAANEGGGGFMGLQFSNSMKPAVAYGNRSALGKNGRNSGAKYGTQKDPLVGHILGGQIVFGGGFGVYADGGNNKVILGGLGVSGDTACYDHSFGWIVRDKLGLDRVPAGVADNNTTDNLIYPIPADKDVHYLEGFEHVYCGFNEEVVVNVLPTNYPIGKNP